jgi:hypothetical protein
MSQTIADDVELALQLGILSYNAKRWTFLERALIRLGEQGFKKVQQAIENRTALEKSKGKTEGFNIWAELHGVRLRAEPTRHNWIRIAETPRTHTFAFRSRRFSETPEMYKQELEKQLNGWKNTVLEIEAAPEPEQTYHAEWLVLYQFEGMSHSQIAEWEDKRGRFIDTSTVSKALKRTANYYYINLKPAKRGGRPRKNSGH